MFQGTLINQPNLNVISHNGDISAVLLLHPYSVKKLQIMDMVTFYLRCAVVNVTTFVNNTCGIKSVCSLYSAIRLVSCSSGDWVHVSVLHTITIHGGRETGWDTELEMLSFDEIFITDCTGSCHFDNFQCSHWWKFHQNDDILFQWRITVMTLTVQLMIST